VLGLMDLSNLNEKQLEAVKSIGQPNLIFAGAGSGKTRVLTYKIAYLIQEVGLSPDRILAVTFTNKAAQEMKSRVQKLLDFDISSISIGTFHSISAQLLRKEIHNLGISNSFIIYDQPDSISVIKDSIKDLGLDIKQFEPKTFKNHISQLKNNLISYDQAETLANDFLSKKVAEVYKIYQTQLTNNSALDFDDLLLKPLELFKNFPNILEKYQKKYSYILVDEYQDTNKPQFEFIHSLAVHHRDICVVGDDDQSIYGWRGADISNILNFSDAFGESKIFKLEQNYRSTQNILDAAYFVISKNSKRADKRIWTDNKIGDPICIIENLNDSMEADKILNLISQNTSSGEYDFSDFVILYRTNAQSRIIEDKLRRQGIPYHIIGGVKFYERKEIKDMLAYLKVISNPSDNVSLLRILNFPARGIGKTSIDKIINSSKDGKTSIFEALEYIEKIEIGQSQKKTIKTFIDKIKNFKNKINTYNIVDLINDVIEIFKIKEHYDKQNTSDSNERWQNIEELVNGMIDYDTEKQDAKLVTFLEEVSLLTDIDKWNDEVKQVTLMTIHSSKGLEFPIVFIAGLEEGLFPISQYLDQNDELEEERRLFYVGATRAMDKLYLTYSKLRRRFGAEVMPMTVSRFINELPEKNIEYIKPKSDFGFSSKTVLKDVTYKKGQLVHHSLFGKGKIIDVEGEGAQSKISVIFHGNVRKKLIAKYANLKIVYN
jgi:DNA helicase-2/ATP-dependent DNA helicase PcrA